MITLTDKAAVKVKQLLESENATDLALRVAVRPGGCSGYSYEMFFDGDCSRVQTLITTTACKMLASRSPTQMLHAVAVVVKALADAS